MRLQASMNIADQIVSFGFSSMIYAAKSPMLGNNDLSSVNKVE